MEPIDAIAAYCSKMKFSDPVYTPCYIKKFKKYICCVTINNTPYYPYPDEYDSKNDAKIGAARHALMQIKDENQRKCERNGNNFVDSSSESTLIDDTQTANTSYTEPMKVNSSKENEFIKVHSLIQRMPKTSVQSRLNIPKLKLETKEEEYQVEQVNHFYFSLNSNFYFHKFVKFLG